MRSLPSVGLAAVLLAVTVGGCAASRPVPGAGATATATAGPGGVQAVTVDAVDGMRFSPGLVRLHTGPVRVTFRNTTAVPHTFTIDGVTDTGNVDGNQTKTVAFTVSRPGRLTFYCAYHRSVGMIGTLVVQ